MTVTDNLNQSITQRLLDENSNLVELIDPNGNSSLNVYDAEDRLETNTHREGGVTAYAYDALDRIIQVTAPNGAVSRPTVRQKYPVTFCFVFLNSPPDRYWFSQKFFCF